MTEHRAMTVGDLPPELQEEALRAAAENECTAERVTDAGVEAIFEDLIREAPEPPRRQGKLIRPPTPERAMPPALIAKPAPTPPRAKPVRPSVLVGDARPLLELLSDYLRQLDHAWAVGKPVKKLMLRAGELRGSIERMLGEPPEIS